MVATCEQVGDPKQLPATVLSQQASRFNFERSLFERMQTAGYPVTLLSTQVSNGHCQWAGWCRTMPYHALPCLPQVLMPQFV